MDIQSKLTEIVDKILPEIIELRHTIHRNPELSGEEFRTAALIRNTLQFTDIELQEPYLKTDVVGILKGAGPGKCVGLRADMDALPLQELNDLPYKSEINGQMHACGHDGHTAMLLGAALALNELRDELKGTVKFIFQPGEEVTALGKELVEAGVLENPKPDAVFAVHGTNLIPLNKILSKPGPIMAACGFLRIELKGVGGHGSRPQDCKDPILAGCRIVEGLQSIVSRIVSPQDSAVVSICHFEGGNNCNVIPESVVIEGTVRFLRDEVGICIKDAIQRMVKAICEANDVKYDLTYDETYIVTSNAADCVDTAMGVAAEYLGQDSWIDMPYASMGGEDFGFYLKKCPGAMCFLGQGTELPGLHNPKFNFNDESIRAGIMFLCGTALKTLDHE
ncbi:M20 family metallopeptidase [Lentisphaerota bacterium ZTH]|nr:amidohydrolase [Lentisphaerota bacterium]WET05602.1 M20 family metallopeptidase [Lentisphaerota bacterium ZTH]